MKEMRRKKQLLSEAETIAVLERGTNGVLAVIDEAGYPYAVPLSYVYCDGKLYFHGAKKGHKIDAIRHCEKASFCVVDKDEIVPEEYTTYFRSVIAFGKVQVLEEETEVKAALMKLAMKYSHVMGKAGCKAVVKGNIASVALILLEIEHMTGKASAKLIAAKQE